MEREEILLAEVPTLGGLYATGARQSISAARAQRREGHAGEIPEVVHEVRDARFDPAQLTDYQHLLGEEGRDAAPAGFVHVAAFPVAMSVLVREDFPLPLMGMVHIANTVEQFAPVFLGEEFSVRAWAQDLRAHRRGALVDVLVEVFVSGELRWRGRSTYLAKGVSVPYADQQGSAGENVAAPNGGPDDSQRPPRVGSWRLPASIGREYGAVSGDRNPIHMSALSAKALGFPRAIAHGMYTAARALAVIGCASDPGFRWDISFAKPVLLPGTVAFGAEPFADGGWRYAGWNPKKEKLHFSGEVMPLSGK